jgi:glycosyltransferase involved in cell wall biosynthesis
MSILVCIPAFNEEHFIGKLIKNCLKYADQVVVCDDGSVDNTYEIADAAGANVIRHEKNCGKGEAFQSLFQFARHSNVDVIVTIDGDGQFLPEEIPKLVKKIESNEADVVIGYRFDGAAEMPNYRKFGNKMLDKMTNMATQLSVRDTQSGFRAYSKNIIKLIDFKKKGFGADTEILINAAKNGARISEEKVSVIYHTGSQTSTKNPISHSGEVITSLIEIIAIRSPLKFVGTPGIILIILGIYFAIDVMLTYTEIGYFSIPFTLIGVSCLVVGLILFLTSILLYSLSKRSKKSENTH